MLGKLINKYTLFILIPGLFLLLGVSVWGYWAFSTDYNYQIKFQNNVENVEKAISTEKENIDIAASLPDKSNEITLVFGGDVMLARHVQTIQEKLADYTSAWKNIYDLTSSADLAIINLESPFIDKPPYPGEGFVFRAKPENIEGLNFAGIDLVNLANNHFGNAGEEGMKFTFKLLQDNNIDYIGAGENEAEAYSAKIINIKDKKLVFIAQSYNVGYQASSNNPGMAVYDLNKLRSGISKIKDEVDFVIVQFHGGIEYTHQPNQEQQLFARTAIDAGADLVIGHHPHWIQEIEKYQGKYIFYSLGNLIFDQNWSQKTSEGLLVKLTIKDDLDYELIPIIIEDNYQPYLADLSTGLGILSNINITSTRLTITK